MKTINIILFILCTSFFTSKAFAQEENAELREIKGKVIDAATKSPASGIKVVTFNDRRYTAMTNEEGEYTIQVPKYATSLTFSAEGYNLIQQPIRNGGVQPTVSMYSDKFQEIYSATTSAVSKKTANVTYNNNDISIDNQIQQSLGSDLYSRMRSGTPGVGNMILMNGLNSLNANAQPLVVIDGVIQYMQYDQNSLHDGFFNNILANIMVEDIEKISVLKNGTAIYGSQGANGVLIIETKRNKSMATKIDVSIGGTYELTPNTPEMMNANDFRIYASELIGTTGTKKNSFKFLQTDPKYYYYNQYHNHTDWSKQVYDEAFTQNYSINVQGGDDVANYNLSVGYAKADATIKDNDFDRFNLRLNSDIVLSKKINIRFDASYSDVTRDMRDDGASANLASNNARYGVVSAPGFLSLIKSPFLSPYAYDTNGEVTHFLAGADDYLSDVLSKESWRTSLANPVSILDNGEGDNKNYFGNRIINIAVTPKWDINKNWSIAEHFSFQIVNTDENYYLPRNGVPHYEVENAGVVENQVSALSGRYIGIMSDTYFNYDHRRNANKLNVRGGFRYINNNYKLNTQIGYNSGNDKTPNMSSSLLYKSIDGTEDKSINMNYYLTSDYNYRERYYLFAGLSLNGSSKFGQDAADGIKIGNYAWGLFSSLELAWVMSNEDWFNIKGIDYLKLNAGFDSSGNDNVNPIANRTYFVAGKLFNNIGTLTIGNIGNTKLQWETTDRFTLGAQIAAFKNRLFVGFNYFFANTRNLLRLNDLSYLSGLYTNWKNDGRLQNQGFDVSANWKVLSLKDWKWDITLSAGHYKNEVKRLPNDTQSMTTPLYGATILTEVGRPANLFFGYRTNGVFSTNDEAKQAGKYILSETGDKVYFEAGDMKFVDSDGNNIINEQDMQVIGDPNPDIYGNISTTLSWKRFTLSLLFNYSLGNDIYNYQRSILESGSYFYNQTIAMSRRWTHEGQLTDIPRASYLDAMGNSRFSDRWIEDGSYLKFKTLSLSYDIPITNTYLQGITIWGAANNLFTITKYLGGDPEFSAFNSIIGMGIDRGLLGQGTNFALGVKINL